MVDYSGTREKCWKWECMEENCGKRKRVRTSKLTNDVSASKHAEAFPGHNVVIIRWTPDGDVFGRVIQVKSRQEVIGGF